MKKIILTEFQKEFLFKNYSKTKNKDISEKLGLSTKVIAKFAKENGLIKQSQDFFTEKQKTKIKELYPVMKNKDLAKMLNINIHTMKGYACSIGLKKSKDYKRFNDNCNGMTLEQKTFIVNNFATMKTNTMCKVLNLTYSQISSYAVFKGLKKQKEYSVNEKDRYNSILEKRQDKEYDVYDYILKEKEPKIPIENLYTSKYGKYHVNQNYFEKIDNEFKAYWLGFLYADGCVVLKNKRADLQIGLASRDRGHLLKFLDSIQSNTVLHEYDILSSGKTRYKSDVHVCNLKICEDLSSKGCTPRKSLSLKFPNEDIVPRHLIRHFIRGYFDGDGWVSYNSKTQKICVGFIGTIDIVSNIKNIFMQELSVFDIKISQKNKDKNTYEVDWCNFVDCEKIYNYMYRDCNIFLDRKLNKFNEILCLG